MKASSRARFAAAAAASAVVIAGPATAGAGPTAPEPPSVGGFTSNLEWIKNVPIEGDVASTHVAYKIGNYLYYDGLQRFSIFDVSDPLRPQLLSQIERPGPGPWPSSTGFWSDVGRSVTNGKIVVMPGGHPDYVVASEPGNRALYVFDISDKTNPQRIAELVVDHTLPGFFCVLGCTWLYDRSGEVIDLRNPRRPRLTYTNWKRGLDFNSSPLVVRTSDIAEVVEVAPGILLTGSVPMYLLDAREDPRRPKVLARSDGTPLSWGDVAWPRFPARKIVISSDPATSFPMCDNGGVTGGTFLEHGFATWDAFRWRTLEIMTPIDTYTPSNGTYVDGNPPTSADPWGGSCGVNRFDVHPRFRDGGLVAAGAMSHGLKILRIDDAGRINEAGWFLPYGYAFTGAAFFITDRIVYAIDLTRGIDILRYTGKI